ncbi:hypothetical protein [Simkania sp.]|uniref:hypothetical protein n=1 Tax=Simkania sp. TaxID=34094 RepID=UPI003B52DC35
MSGIDFIRLSWIYAPRMKLEEAKGDEKQKLEELLSSMESLQEQNDSNIDFTNCCEFANQDQFTDSTALKKACQFERCRRVYMLRVLSFARALFGNDFNREEKFYNHVKQQLRIMDPDLIGESRYFENDWTITKICKAAFYFISRQFYSWTTDEITIWKMRYEILEWAATQNPHTVIYPRTREESVEEIAKTRFIPKTVSDQLIRDVFIRALGFQEEDIESLQGVLELLPGEMKTASYNPKTGEAQFALDQKWIGRPNWAKLEKSSKNPIPEVIAPISMLIEDMQKSGTPIPNALKAVGNRLAIVPKGARIEIAQTVKGTVEKDSEGTTLKIQEGSMRFVIPARFGLFSPDIYVDVQELRRLSNGSLKMTIKPGASTGFDTTIKGIVAAITKIAFGESSTTITSPPEGEGDMRLPDASELKEIRKDVFDNFQWGS